MRSVEHTETALRLARHADDPLLIDEALDQLTTLALAAGDLDEAATVSDRRLTAIGSVPIDTP